ncbi:MAG: hypothetical protein NTY65_18350 [Planctomycetota bacterium]|nr:hypothetical protein [Planctomycetota bacterium]
MKRRDFLKIIGSLSAMPSSLVSTAEVAPRLDSTEDVIQTKGRTRPGWAMEMLKAVK